MTAAERQRAERGGDEQVALVLPVVIVGDNDQLAAGESGHGGPDALVSVVHLASVSRPQRAGGENGQSGVSPTWPR